MQNTTSQSDVVITIGEWKGYGTGWYAICDIGCVESVAPVEAGEIGSQDDIDFAAAMDRARYGPIPKARSAEEWKYSETINIASGFRYPPSDLGGYLFDFGWQSVYDEELYKDCPRIGWSNIVFKAMEGDK